MTERVRLDVDTPPDIDQVYTQLATQFNVDPAAPSAYVPPAKTRFLKMLMPSYLEASGFASLRTESRGHGQPLHLRAGRWRASRQAPTSASGAAEVGCRARHGDPPARARRTARTDPRERREARRCLVLRKRRLALRDAARHQRLFRGRRRAGLPEALCGPHPAVEGGRPGARCSRPSCSPWAPCRLPGSFDEILREADVYSDGFARLVHTFQPDRADYLNLSRQDERRLRPVDGDRPEARLGRRADRHLAEPPAHRRPAQRLRRGAGHAAGRARVPRRRPRG